MKYRVYITFSTNAYVDVEAESEEEAIEEAASMDDSNYTLLSDDIEDYEAEELPDEEN